jgi:hypothetical protein
MVIIAALISVIGVLAGIYFGLSQFNQQQESNRKQKYWEEQFTIYKEACEAAAAIAVAATMKEVETDRKNFWTLYWGRMSLIENQQVETAMANYGRQLELCEKGAAEPSSLKELSYKVAHSCRDSLKDTWRPVDIGTLKERDFNDKKIESKDEQIKLKPD